jgi:hypothetical protein
VPFSAAKKDKLLCYTVKTETKGGERTMGIVINYIGLLLAGIVSMAMGFLWYSPAVMGKPWMKLMGYTSASLKKAQQEMGKMYALSFAAALVTAFVLTHMMALSRNFYGYGTVTTGITTAFWVWLGFVAPVQMTDVLFGSKKWELFAINTGYQLLSLVSMGIVLGFLL